MSIYFLIDGIVIYDSVSKQDFLLHCHVILWTGDIPAITKLMCISGHNSYFGCRFCYLKGTYCKHVYFPCGMPRGYNDNIDYCPSNLNKRTETSFQQDILFVENSENETIRKENTRQTGKII